MLHILETYAVREDTLDRVMEFGGPGLASLPMDERAVWRGPYEERRRVQSAAGLMIGDMGSSYIFVCRSCPGWPIRSITQCS